MNATPLGWRPILERLVQILLQTAVLFGLSFLAAGTLDWPRAWIFIAVSIAVLLVNGSLVLRYNPVIVIERGRRHRGTKPFDWAFAAVFGVALLLLQLVAGLDAIRFGWAPLPGWTLWLGIALYALGDIPLCAALCTNPHLETTVRIQEDRNHRVITAGPYRYVRHPMYAAMLLQLPATPLALGSAWALVPAAAALAALVARTAAEDRALRRELPGYSEYSQRTRYRLVPGLW